MPLASPGASTRLRRSSMSIAQWTLGSAATGACSIRPQERSNSSAVARRRIQISPRTTLNWAPRWRLPAVTDRGVPRHARPRSQADHEERTGHEPARLDQAKNTKGITRAPLWGSSGTTDHLTISRNTDDATADENRFKHVTSGSTLGVKGLQQLVPNLRRRRRTAEIGRLDTRLRENSLHDGEDGG